MTIYQFDPSAIQWTRFGEFEPAFHYSILHVDEKSRIVDAVFKLPANQRIVLHVHHALNHTFVIQGEHRLYETDGALREIRRAGRYTVSPASERPHREGGGEQEAIVLFSIRPGTDELIYELLDDAGDPVGTITFQTLVELYQAQLAGRPE
ncbi:regulator [Duganella sp. FT92W]|uniref:Regulator n=1 Tax=Pseudoduganella rivuli TaxID=2666085 RepID=A0A7X2IKE3_9BURK|nr:regulator [Pseudoduganella rivuli]MRV71470.1 regulator [Pseudoduganella rivuli]